MPIRSDDAGLEPGPLPHLFRDAERLGVSVGRAATATPYSDCGAPLISTGIRRSLTNRISAAQDEGGGAQRSPKMLTAQQQMLVRLSLAREW